MKNFGWPGQIIHNELTWLASFHHCHGDYEELLAFEGGDERGLVVVVDKDRFHACGRLVGAAGAGEGCYSVLASCNQGRGEVLADLTASLSRSSVELKFLEGEGAYPDDGNVLNSVSEARGLILGVIWGHI